MAIKPFDWPDYLALAAELSTRRMDEACLRTAVSRTYYYVYHLARQRIIQNGFIINRNEPTHKQVWEKFDNDPDFRCKKLSQIAKRIQGKRLSADYESVYPKIEKEFPVLIEEAQRFAQQLNQLEQRLPAYRGVRT